jgi:hypothetical protein
MTGERVWLRHPVTGGAFHCPIGAAGDWRRAGWVDGEPPAEANPAVAELLAAQAAAKPVTERKAKR